MDFPGGPVVKNAGDTLEKILMQRGMGAGGEGDDRG